MTAKYQKGQTVDTPSGRGVIYDCRREVCHVQTENGLFIFSYEQISLPEKPPNDEICELLWSISLRVGRLAIDRTANGWTVECFPRIIPRDESKEKPEAETIKYGLDMEQAGPYTECSLIPMVSVQSWNWRRSAPNLLQALRDMSKLLTELGVP